MPIPSAADVASAGTGHAPPGPVQRVVGVGEGQAADASLATGETVRVRFTRLHAHGAATYRTGDVAWLPRQAAGHLVAIGAATLHNPAGEN